MSLVLTGNPANITTPLQATITALADNGSGAIRATTSTPHFFGTNDHVIMVTTVVTGTFEITVIDSTHFDLVGSTYTATGTGTATDLSLTPQIQVPTDGDAFSAQLSGLLSGFQGVLDRTQYLQEICIALASDAGQVSGATAALATTWTAPVLADPVFEPTQHPNNSHAEWDAVNNQWIVMVSGSASANIYCSYDGWDDDWRFLISGGFGPYASPTTLVAGKDPNDATTFYAGETDSTQVIVSTCVAPSTVTTAYADVAAGYTDVQIGSINGYVVIATANSASNAKNNLISSNNKFSTNSTTNVGATTGKPNQWLLRSNGSMMIAMPRLGNGGFALPYVWTTTDGHTWTERTLSFLAGTDLLAGLDWGVDAQGSCWILSVQHIATSKGDLYRSSDGINWTKVPGTPVNTLFNVVSLAAVGRVWIAVLAASPGPHTMIYSLDTVNWSQMSAKLLGTSGEARVRSNGFQAAGTNASGARFTEVQGPAVTGLT